MKFRNRYWQVQNRPAAEQVALLQRIRAGGVDVHIDEASAVEPDPLLVGQTGPDALLFDLEPFGTGLIVQIGITCKAAKFFIAGCQAKLPIPHPHPPFDLLEASNMQDKFREYAFPGGRPETRSYREVINRRLGRMRRGDRLEGLLLMATPMPMPAHWGRGSITLPLAFQDPLDNTCSTKVRLLVQDPVTRNGERAAMALKSSLCRPARTGAGRRFATDDSSGTMAPQAIEAGAIQFRPVARRRREAPEDRAIRRLDDAAGVFSG